MLFIIPISTWPTLPVADPCDRYFCKSQRNAHRKMCCLFDASGNWRTRNTFGVGRECGARPSVCQR
jgi:hypothetical protein